jgi:hypothetical protein
MRLGPANSGALPDRLAHPLSPLFKNLLSRRTSFFEVDALNNRLCLREVSLAISTAVAEVAYERGLATMPRPDDRT